MIFSRSNKLKIFRPLGYDPEGYYTGILNDFRKDHEQMIFAIYLRGQEANPIRQHDVHTTASKMRVLILQRSLEYQASISALKQEIEDLIKQLSQPLEIEKKETLLVDKIFIIWEKLKHAVGKH